MNPNGLDSNNVMRKKDISTTAYHEAGHAVMYYVTRKRFNKVSIIPGHNYLGIVDEPPINTYALSYNPFRESIISMAGSIAESIHNGGEVIYHSCIIGAADHARSAYGQRETCDAFLNFIFLYTKDLVNKWWPEIEALANELMKKKEIGYLKAYKLIKESFERRLWGEKYEEQKAWEQNMKTRQRRRTGRT